jgi:hypothetical protein
MLRGLPALARAADAVHVHGAMDLPGLVGLPLRAAGAQTAV